MAKVFYFTTALSNEDYKDYLSLWSVPPNLSNQNFHNKFIRSISLTHPVEVISLRPINNKFGAKTLHSATKIEKNITWNYIKVSSNLVDKYLNTSKRILSTIKNKIDSESVIFVDVLNRALLKAALKAKAKYNCCVIGICTDNPYNISFVRNGYGDEIINLSSNLDGYVALTNKLLELFNKQKKPSVVIDGITESVNYDSKIEIEGDYLFFGGSLMKKYGVYNLIDAFERLDIKNLKLVICGHHEESDFKTYIKDIKNVIYLGALPYQDVIAIERKAVCAINPRPIDPQIDNYSIPSKTLEYLASGVLTICVENKLLKEKYKDAIIWAKSGNVGDLYQAIEKALKLNNREKEKLITLGLKYIEQNTSFKNINKKVSELFL